MKEPKFVPKPGQVDYTSVRYAPVVNTLVTDESKLLLVKRSQKLNLYPGVWNGVSGFLDDNQTIETKIKQELAEELGLQLKSIDSLKVGQPFIQEAPEYAKTWIVIPALATIKNKKIILDWEAEKAQWFKPEDIKSLKLMPGFEKVIKEFFPGFKIQ